MRDGLGYPLGPLGPLAPLDIAGLDVSPAIQRRLHEAFHDPALAPARYLEHLVHAGHLGRKTGRGFHAYPAAESPRAAEAVDGLSVS